MKVYQILAQLVDACKRCERDGNQEWANQHKARIKQICRECLPSGGGFDNGTTLDLEDSTANKLVLHTSFHHMNETGYYLGWTSHKIKVKPNLAFDFLLVVSGQNENEIKDLIQETFEFALSEETPEKFLV